MINSQAASDALADSVNITWGVTKAAANFGTLLNGYVQRPACGYRMTISPMIAYSQMPSQGYLQLPTPEVWETNPLDFNFAKCVA